jgi:hypothetical protein
MSLRTATIDVSGHRQTSDEQRRRNDGRTSDEGLTHTAKRRHRR